MKISLKILEFYGAKYLLKSSLAVVIFSKYIFLWILALSDAPLENGGWVTQWPIIFPPLEIKVRAVIISV